jgi:TolA-binding protein
VQALRLVFERHPGDPNAAIAAFTLGNLLESAGDKAGAAAAFEIHRRLSPKGDLADSALAREFDLAVDSGDLERARQLADQYAKDYPKGRRLGAMRKRLAELSGAPPVAEGVEGDESEDETDEVVSPSGP